MRFSLVPLLSLSLLLPRVPGGEEGRRQSEVCFVASVHLHERSSASLLGSTAPSSRAPSALALLGPRFSSAATQRRLALESRQGAATNSEAFAPDSDENISTETGAAAFDFGGGETRVVPFAGLFRCVTPPSPAAGSLASLAASSSPEDEACEEHSSTFQTLGRALALFKAEVSLEDLLRASLWKRTLPPQPVSAWGVSAALERTSDATSFLQSSLQTSRGAASALHLGSPEGLHLCVGPFAASRRYGWRRLSDARSARRPLSSSVRNTLRQETLSLQRQRQGTDWPARGKRCVMVAGS